MGMAPNGRRSLAGGITRTSVNKGAEENQVGAGLARQLEGRSEGAGSLLLRTRGCLLLPSGGGALWGACLGCESSLSGWRIPGKL